jgi:aminopeptidase YwaD
MVLFEEDEALRSYISRNSKPHIPLRLKDAEQVPIPPTIASLSKAGIERLSGVKDGAMVTLTVHALPLKPRRTFNAVGYLEGTDPGSGTILLSAHLDHLGVTSAPAGGDAIYNGANDDASGTTAVLELARAMASGARMKRSLLFVCYGSEEAGELGSEFFATHSPIPLAKFIADIEFEMIGAQDPKLPKNFLMLTGWERSDLGPALRDHGAMLGPDMYPEQNYFERSDNYQLAVRGVIAHTASGWGKPATYHQLNDDLAHLNFDYVTRVIQSFVEPVRWLAGSDFKPTWSQGGQPRR